VNASKANSLSTREQSFCGRFAVHRDAARDGNVEASTVRVSLAQALYDQAADLQKEGVGNRIDTLPRQTSSCKRKQRLIEAETDRETSLFALSRSLEPGSAARTSNWRIR